MISIISMVTNWTSGLSSNSQNSSTIFGTIWTDPSFKRVVRALFEASFLSDIPLSTVCTSSVVCCDKRSLGSRFNLEMTFCQTDEAASKRTLSKRLFVGAQGQCVKNKLVSVYRELTHRGMMRDEECSNGKVFSLRVSGCGHTE